MDLTDKQIQILEASEKLFAEHGFDGTSVRQIALAADINIAMISYYFGSKEKLLQALFKHKMEDFRMELESLLSNDSEYFLTLEAIIALMVQRVHRNRLSHKIMNFELSNDSRDIDFNTYLEQKKENYDLFEGFIIKGQDAGVFSKNVQVKLIIPTITGSYFHWYYNKKFFKSYLSLNHDQPSLDAFVHGQLTQHIQQTIKALLTHEN